MGSVGLILTPGFADWEYAYIAGIGAPFYGMEVRFFTPVPGQLRSQGGLAVTVDDSLQQCVEWNPDVLAVIGGMVWDSAEAPDITEYLSASWSNGATIAGICGGTLALAGSGLLDAVSHTSNNLEFLRENAAAYKGDEHYRKSSVAIVDERIITAPGSAPVSFTCAVFEAAGLPAEVSTQFRSILAAEHE